MQAFLIASGVKQEDMEGIQEVFTASTSFLKLKCLFFVYPATLLKCMIIFCLSKKRFIRNWKFHIVSLT